MILGSGSCYSIYQPLLLLLCFLSFFSINTPLCIYISPSIPDENVVTPLALGLSELRHPSLFYFFLMSVQVHLLWSPCLQSLAKPFWNDHGFAHKSEWSYSSCKPHLFLCLILVMTVTLFTSYSMPSVYLNRDPSQRTWIIRIQASVMRSKEDAQIAKQQEPHVGEVAQLVPGCVYDCSFCNNHLLYQVLSFCIVILTSFINDIH